MNVVRCETHKNKEKQGKLKKFYTEILSDKPKEKLLNLLNMYENKNVGACWST